MAGPAEAQPAPFPLTLTYTPVTCGGAPATDAIRDQPGANDDLDIVGDASNPAMYYANDGTYFYLRLRVDGDPRVSALPTAPLEYNTAGWGFEFDTNSDLKNYEYLLVLDGQAGSPAGESVALWLNTTTAANAIGSPTDAAEQLLNTAVANTRSRVELALSTFRSNPDYFVTVAIALSDLQAAGFPFGSARVWGGTSPGGSAALGKDIVCHDASVDPVPLFSNIPVDPISVGPSVSITAPASGSTTTDTTPTISGKATPNATVSLALDGGTAVTVMANASGDWTFTPTTALTNGAHTAVATVRDAGGRTSTARSTFTVSNGDADGDTVPDATECPTLPCADTDMDGTPDITDPDDDNDGILTKDEVADATAHPTEAAADGDGKAPYLDTDSDGDGAPDLSEGRGDSNMNGLPDYLDPAVVIADADGDGVPDSVECPTPGSCPNTDGDALTNDKDADDDGDGVLTKDERPAGVSVDTDGDGTPDFLDADDDGDTVPTIVERPLGVSTDSDLDTKPDYLDGDDDGDGILTKDEVADATAHPTEAAADGDAIDPYLDLDSDGDAIPDSVEGRADTDMDLLPDYLDVSVQNTDTDGDGVPNVVECPPTAACPDTDGDGTPDVADADDDGDTILTKDELADAAAHPAEANIDGDGIPPYLDTDSDGDGASDMNEGRGDANTNGIPDYLDPAGGSLDSDGDGVADVVECPPLAATCPDADGDGTVDKDDTDDDGDGILTKDELADTLAHPTEASADGDNVPAYLDTDADGDGIPDSVEGRADADGDGIPNYLDTDSDGDGISDAVEGRGDNDGDGVPNYLDTDSDNDGIPDSVEGTGDSDGDGVADYLDAPGGLAGGARCSAAPYAPTNGAPIAIFALVLAALGLGRRRAVSRSVNEGENQ